MKVLNDALYDALAGNAGVAALVGTRIYRVLAPIGATYPLITFQLMPGGPTNETPSEAQEHIIRITGESRVDSDSADQLGDAIHAAIHKNQFTVTGWTNIWTRVVARSNPIELQVDGVPIWHALLNVNIRLSQ